MAEKVSGQDIPYTMADRRPGDPAILIADAGKAKAILGWEPKRSDVAHVIGNAWRWHQSHPTGYASTTQGGELE